MVSERTGSTLGVIMYTPFLRPRKAPEVNGVYRHKESGNIMVLKNMKLMGFINGETGEPYDGYRGKIWIEADGQGWINPCIVTPETLQEHWERLVQL
jgi:hypothetical protein